MKVTWDIDGLGSSNVHAFNIHEYGDLNGACASFGSHWNPDGTAEGLHAGDIGDLTSDSSGEANGSKWTDMTLYGP